MQEKIDHLKHNIYVGGIGVILMGFWSMAKILISIVLGFADYLKQPEFETLTEDDITAVIIVVVIVMAVFSVILIFIHLLIGLNAIRFAKGKKYRKLFLVVVIVFLVLQVLGIPSYFTNITDDDALDSLIAAALVDITLIFILGDIFVSVFKVKKLEKNREE